LNPLTREVFIYDVTTATDHLLWEEEAFLGYLKEKRITIEQAIRRGAFGDDGKLTPIGLEMIEPEHHGDVHRIKTFTQARYRIRYAKLAKVLEVAMRTHGIHQPKVRVLTFAVGTGGYIPMMTETELKALVPGKAAMKKVRGELMDISHRLAIKVYGAWKEEQEAHYASLAEA
jgi:hypothetical protein